jgi:hypothetical protein
MADGQRSRRYSGSRFLLCALRLRILSQGKTEEGFDKLDEFGVIREIEKTDERIKIKAICDLHIGAIRKKQSSLIVAPTHGEDRRIAAAVRKEFRGQGLIEEAEHLFTRRKTEPDKGTARGRAHVWPFYH